MKILIVNSFYYPEIEGGAEYSVKMLSEELVRLGNSVTVLCTGKEKSEEQLNGVTILRFRSHCLKRAKDCINAKSYVRKIHRLLDVYNPFNYAQINRVIEKVQPDVIHTNGLYDISPVVWTVARNKKIPIVHTLRDYYLICEHGNLLRRKNSCVCEKTRCICEVYRFINSVFARNVDFVTAPSNFTLENVCNAKLFSKAQKKVIFNASEFDNLNLKNIVAQRTMTLEECKIFKFVYLGVLSEHKGLKWLIQSFMSFNNTNVKLIVAGKGPLEKYVVESMQEDDRISYAGFLKSDEINLLLKDAFMLVCPSLWNEPFGRVVLDAYRMGLPVIATNMGALPSIVCNDVTGYIIDSNNREELTRVLKESIADKNKYCNFLNNIPNFVEQFSLEYQANMFLKIYDDCVKK